jgi:hypothetical protein
VFSAPMRRPHCRYEDRIHNQTIIGSPCSLTMRRLIQRISVRALEARRGRWRRNLGARAKLRGCGHQEDVGVQVKDRRALRRRQALVDGPRNNVIAVGRCLWASIVQPVVAEEKQELGPGVQPKWSGRRLVPAVNDIEQ